MPATFSNPPSPAPLRPLAIAMVAAAMGHMLFIEGLPRLSSPEVEAVQADTLETRIIVPVPEDTPVSDMETLPEPPAAPPEPPPEPAAPPPPEPPPTPAPEPAPEVAPPPAPAEPAVAPEAPPEPAPTPETPAPAPASEADMPPPPPAPTGPSLRSLSEQASQIEGSPAVTFGGSESARPVPPVLSGLQTETVLQQMAQAVDGQAKLPRPTDLTYETQYQRDGQTIAGRSRLAWRHDSRYYEARWSEMHTRLGNNSLRVTGAVAPQGLAPVNSVSERPPGATTRFDYAAQQAHITPKASPSERHSVPFVTGTQDPIGALLHLGSLIAGQPERFPIGTRIRVPVLQDGHTQAWVFTVEAQSTLKALKDQELPVLHLVHQSGNASAEMPTAPASAASGPAANASAPASAASSPASSSTAAGTNAATTPPPTGPNAVTRLDLWLGPTVDFLPVQWRIETANGQVTQHVLRAAVEQRVLQSLPPPRDHLPGEAPPAPVPPAAAPAPTPAPVQAFPESGGG